MLAAGEETKPKRCSEPRRRTPWGSRRTPVARSARAVTDRPWARLPPYQRTHDRFLPSPPPSSSSGPRTRSLGTPSSLPDQHPCGDILRMRTVSPATASNSSPMS